MIETMTRIGQTVRRWLRRRVPEPLARISAAVESVAAAESERDAAIAAARAAGHSWAEIGAAWGISGQAAGRHARRREIPDEPPVRETRAEQRARLAAAHGALLIREMGVDQAREWFPSLYGVALPEAAHTAEPADLPAGYARRRAPLR